MKVSKVLKIIIVNLIVFFFLISTIIILPPIAIDSYRIIKNKISGEKKYVSKENQLRSKLINYQNIEWASDHFNEIADTKFKYYDYIGWRRDKFTGKTINIDNSGFRKNSEDHVLNFENSDVWVFGGSVVWGTGSNDSQTIPALLENFNDIKVLNMGESGYTSHQNLNLFMKLLSQNYLTKKVFFFDGPNEIIHKCRVENSFFSSAREDFIRKKINDSERKYKYETQYLFDSTKKLIFKLKKKFSISKNSDQKDVLGDRSLFDCDNNFKKVNNIVNSIYLDWSTAKKIAEDKNIKFIPILQPTIFFGKAQIEHLDESLKREDLRVQFESVYPKLLAKLESENFEYINLLNIFDDNNIFYIDFMHFSPNGNKKIVNLISNLFIK